MSKRKADLTSVGGILLGAALGALITLGIGSMRQADLHHYADVQVFGDADHDVECNVDITAAPGVRWSSSGETVVFSLNSNRLISNPRRVVVRGNVVRLEIDRNIDRSRLREIIVRENVEHERVAHENVEHVTISPDVWVMRSADHGEVHCEEIEEIARRAEAEAKEAIARQFEEIDMLHFEDVARELERAARQVAEQRDRLVFRMERLEGGELDRVARELELKALQLHEMEGELEAQLEAQLKNLEKALETEVERRKRRKRRPHEGG